MSPLHFLASSGFRHGHTDWVEALQQPRASRASVPPHINATAPDDEHRRLDKVELTARSLETFAVAQPPILENCQFPDWEHSDRKLWPLPQPSIAAAYAASMRFGYDPRYSADWASANERRPELIQAEHEKLAAYYDAAKQQEPRGARALHGTAARAAVLMDLRG
jgi:hypothetical protein